MGRLASRVQIKYEKTAARERYNGIFRVKYEAEASTKRLRPVHESGPHQLSEFRNEIIYGIKSCGTALPSQATYWHTVLILETH
jgi:hypothetical protein